MTQDKKAEVIGKSQKPTVRQQLEGTIFPKEKERLITQYKQVGERVYETEMQLKAFDEAYKNIDHNWSPNAIARIKRERAQINMERDALYEQASELRTKVCERFGSRGVDTLSDVLANSRKNQEEYLDKHAAVYKLKTAIESHEEQAAAKVQSKIEELAMLLVQKNAYVHTWMKSAGFEKYSSGLVSVPAPIKELVDTYEKTYSEFVEVLRDYNDLKGLETDPVEGVTVALRVQESRSPEQYKQYYEQCIKEYDQQDLLAAQAAFKDAFKDSFKDAEDFKKAFDEFDAPTSFKK